jgi:ABC-type dipeptide/oligopeptide/nickel transport systems, permease components
LHLLKRYIIPRLIQWLVVIFVGVTVAFIVPRLSPLDPVQNTLNRMAVYGLMYPEAVESLRATLEELYGLKGTVFEQYIAFWKRLLTGDFGPSLSVFPTPVIQLILQALPWTIGLLVTSTITAWILGIVIGTLAGVYSESRFSKVLETLVMCISPIPYYIMALTLVLLFAYLIPIFPLAGGAAIGLRPSFSWTFISSVLKHGFLPAFSLVIISMGWYFLSQKALTSTLVASDFVTYARIAAVPRRTILYRYLIRNSLLPQATDLALGLGSVFGGALITEVVFSYPGIGQVLNTAIFQGDFNLMMGIIILSVVGIATGALIIDLLYPLLDPRVRYH